jgi:hypothetical protein
MTYSIRCVSPSNSVVNETIAQIKALVTTA